MGFKSIEQYEDDKYRYIFRIPNDKGTADVVFLYRDRSDMMIADVHYLMTPQYKGYVHCCGENCPVCALKKKDGTPLIRRQTIIFIPVYEINANKGKGAIKFWSKTPTYEPEFKREVFDPYPDPSEFVFRITRDGAYKDQNTRYHIRAIGKISPDLAMDQILARNNAKLPDYYENVVKEFSIAELTEMIESRNSSAPVEQEYVPIPRAGYQSSIPNTYVNAATVVENTPEVSEPIESDNDGGDEELPDPIF